MDAYDCVAFSDVASGRAYVIGTHFCFPPIYAMHADTGRGPLQWVWTHDIANASCSASKDGAERKMRDDPGLAHLLAKLDDATRKRVGVLRVGLKISPAGDDKKEE